DFLARSCRQQLPPTLRQSDSAWRRQAMSRGTTWGSSIGLRRANTIGCRPWPVNCCAAKWRGSLPWAPPRHSPQRVRPQAFPSFSARPQTRAISASPPATPRRPGGNATGVSFLLSELAPKQLGLLRELLPAASRFGLLVNPKNENAETITRDLKAAAAKISVEISVVQASNSREIEAAFAALV